MSSVMITQDETSANGQRRTIEVSVEGGSDVLVLARSEAHGLPAEVQVIVQNAVHKVWRGMGKTFPDIQTALAHYKSAKVKAALQCVADLLAK